MLTYRKLPSKVQNTVFQVEITGSRVSALPTFTATTVIAARYSRLDLKSTPIKTIFVDKKKVNRDTKQNRLELLNQDHKSTPNRL